MSTIIKRFFSAMVKNFHIYVLYHDLKVIQQKHMKSKIPYVKASTDYYINDVEAPPYYRMIRDVKSPLLCIAVL